VAAIVERSSDIRLLGHVPPSRPEQSASSSKILPSSARVPEDGTRLNGDHVLIGTPKFLQERGLTIPLDSQTTSIPTTATVCAALDESTVFVRHQWKTGWQLGVHGFIEGTDAGGDHALLGEGLRLVNADGDRASRLRLYAKDMGFDVNVRPLRPEQKAL